MRIWKVFAFISILLLPHSFVSADWVWSPEQGKFINTEENTQADADEIFDGALDFYKEKKLDKAVEQFEIILKKYPKSRVAAESEYRLGTIFEEQGDLVKAHKTYQSLVKSYPQSERFEEVVEREFLIGETFLSGKKKGKVLGLEIRPSLPLAIEVFKQVVESAPYGAFGDKAQFSLGLAYQKSNKYDEAVEAFQGLIDQYPQSPLVQEARLQIAQTAYAKTAGKDRDQTALDEASRQAQGYLQRYPQSADAEKAAKIRQQVDEINAEKNYRIGLYYEKENYLESSLIYYRDTARRYPQTGWGQKAAEKLRALEEPVKYLNAKSEELQKEINALEEKYHALGKEKKAERAQLKKEIDALKKRMKSIDKNKAESLDRRKQDLRRRENELNERFKDLERKKKRYKNNTSPDFQKAIARWQASLEAERDALAEEKDRLATWRSELGVPDQKFYEGLIPFSILPETPLEKIRKMDEKGLYKLSRKKKEIFQKKEKLYKRYSELAGELTPQVSETGVARKRLRGKVAEGLAKPTDPKLIARLKEIEGLQGKLDTAMALYEKHFGKLAEQELEALLDSRSPVAAPEALSGPGAGDLQNKKLEELLQLKMHLNEKIATQQNIVDTLSTAFDKELARREQQEMMRSLDQEKQVDGRKLRKEIKKTEKDMRRRYQDIEDRRKHVQKLLAELDATLHPTEGKNPVLTTVAKPVTGTLYLAKSFLFGLPNEDVELTKSAGKTAAEAGSVAKAKQLKEEIELESLMIQAQEQEIAKFEKELEILNAKASLAGGMKFRSSFVKVPYAFIEEAVQSARRVIPKKDRKEVLLNRLDQQTRELDGLKKQQTAVEVMIQEKTPKPTPPAATPSEATPQETTAETSSKDLLSASPKKKNKAEVVPDEKALREEVVRIQEELEISYSIYVQEQGIALGDIPKEVSPTDVEGTKKYRELAEVKSGLVKVIDEELAIEIQEKMILEKRIHETDRVLPTIKSKAMYQDLVTEKERMRQRLKDLETRDNFLSKEKERFSKV
ncbi:MAG TPA: outer membrane protein assembly factor BamD [Candidatus Omnitrophota bacterium]|nr:outer membrane protein assembly factor BamD [Candidatus Omnitrophota bacterium]HPS37598.1 outer membrane protein assembly factor BamD [Candidatus Omnitrophota bacterium]